MQALDNLYLHGCGHCLTRGSARAGGEEDGAEVEEHDGHSNYDVGSKRGGVDDTQSKYW